MLVRRYWQIMQTRAEVIRGNRQSLRFAKFANVTAMTDDEPSRNKAPNAEVRRLVRASGMKQDQVADYLTRRLGREFAHYHISRMISGGRKVAHDEMDALRELADRPNGEQSTFDDDLALLAPTGDIVPLFGFSNAAGATVKLNDEARIGTVPIHPAQRGSRGAYAFVTWGISVSPRLNHGEIGYAIRNRPPFKDQLCVVTKSDGEALVKFYDRQDDRTVYIYETTPKRREIALPLRDVLRIDAVVGATFGSG